MKRENIDHKDRHSPATRRSIDLPGREVTTNHDPHRRLRTNEVLDHKKEQSTENHNNLSKNHEKEALDIAKTKVEHQAIAEKAPRASPEVHHKPVRKIDREASFQHIMEDIRPKMSPSSRVFSEIIHNPVIEKVSDGAGKTVARPNAILAGSISASVAVLATYIIARQYGYPLSGAETIVSFAIGWMIGIIYDFAKTAFRVK